MDISFLTPWIRWYWTNPYLHTVILIGTLILFIFIYAIIQTRIYETIENTYINGNLQQLKTLVTAVTNQKISVPPLTALITGANSGIGLGLAEQLAGCGLRVILGCRSKQRGTEAINKILKKYPKADVRLLLIDVADPVSVLQATQSLRTDPTIGGQHIDYLILNAGIMPMEYYRWSVAIKSFLYGRIRCFLETSRPDLTSPSFLANPVDDLGYEGAPSVFATHVLGHLLLSLEIQDLMVPLPNDTVTNYFRLGRIIWTGSRSSASVQTDWKSLLPPVKLGELSGYQKQLKDKTNIRNDTYAQAKYAQDLINIELAKHVRTPTAVLCPGFVATELTPAFFNMGIPLFTLIRKYAPSMTLTKFRGTAAHIALMVSPESLLREGIDRKWVLNGDRISPAVYGNPSLYYADVQRMWNICNQWLTIWRESANKQVTTKTVGK